MFTISPTTIASLLLLTAAALAARRRDLTFLLDAAFVALYARFPLPATLVLVGVQLLVRRVPTLAREVAVVLQVHEPAGWTLRTLLFVLPGLRAYLMTQPEGWQRFVRNWATEHNVDSTLLQRSPETSSLSVQGG
jgi:hypothetical protein